MTGAQLELLPTTRPAPTGTGDQEVRLRESRRERARCPACGKLGILEVLTVHRPGLPSVRRTVIRCTRAGRKDPRGRELASSRCPLTVVSEEPLPVVAGEFREFCEDHEKGVGEFWQFCQDHKKGPDPDPLPAVEAARAAQDAFEAPPPPVTSIDPEPAPLGQQQAQREPNPEPEEVATMPEEPTRTCTRCNAPINGTGGRRYCQTCAEVAKREARHVRHLRAQARKHPQTPAAVPAGRPMTTNDDLRARGARAFRSFRRTEKRIGHARARGQGAPVNEPCQQTVPFVYACPTS